MRRPSRELAIFSVSAIDLFASAMGSFILIAIVLFPYYLNTTTAQEAESLVAEAQTAEEKVEALEKQVAALQEALAEAEKRAAAAEDEAEAAKAEAAGASQAELEDAQARIEALEEALAAAEARAQAAEAAAEQAKADQPGGAMRLPPGGGTDTEFAVGCWRTDPFRHRPGAPPGISQYCFDRNGNGNLVFYREAQGEICGAFATIRRSGNRIRIDDSDSRCSVGQRDMGPWYADHLDCVPDPNGVIMCRGVSQGASWTVRLYRQ